MKSKAKTLLEYGSFELRKRKSLAQRLTFYPNNGIGFTLQNTFDPNIKYIINRIKYDGTKCARIFGLKINNDIKDNKITEIIAPNQYKIVKIPENTVYTTNGNIFDISKLNSLIKLKLSLLEKRKALFEDKPADIPKENKNTKKK